MKLYRRKLSSVDDLKREKTRLRYERLSTKSSDLYPIAEIGKKKKGSDVAASNFLGLAMSMLNARNSTERVMKVAPFLLKRLGKSRADKDGKPGKSILAKVSGDVLSNYLIGKGITVSAQLLTGYIKKRRAKAREEKLLKKMRLRGWH